MIPYCYDLGIRCDRCGDSRTFRLKCEDIDRLGIFSLLSDSLTEEAWEISGDYTFCPRCVRSILDGALAEVARSLESKPRPAVSDAEASV